ncbi:palmitoyltransferase ZDHHC23-like isoform X1 [Macrosteles quadrilineatus]|uniref:palmitoyltransferase ZDHHC23-like isoform X1 n=3 Tax=Macrosteles quadrilineatus TaxID=74068 RepID=UPI0023E228E6|nr:palmitoyltransferase ZDHHC23-like isoform X1 [Macrosteles quadrilineatus]
MHAHYFQLDSMDDEERSLNLCCCEYIDANDERNHILGCCCNCSELDMCIDKLFKCQGMAPRTFARLFSVLKDRFRIPWRGGARQLNIDSIIPIILLPALGYIAAQGVWISVVVFTSLPIFLIYTHYIFMRISSQTKFFYVWTLVSVILIVSVFEVPVVVTLDIQPEEHKMFLLFTILMVFCGVKTRLTAEQSHVKGDVKIDESLLECAVCHKSVLPRTFHCCICRTCIIKRDQHCAWLDCCIGESNYRWFMATLVTAVCQLALCSNLILTTACHPFTVFATIMLPDDCSDVYFDILYATIFVTALYAILALLFLIVLLLHECWLISLGMTGHEWRNVSDRVCCGVRSNRPYSKGFLRNWTDFFLGSRSKQMSTMII